MRYMVTMSCVIWQVGWIQLIRCLVESLKVELIHVSRRYTHDTLTMPTFRLLIHVVSIASTHW